MDKLADRIVRAAKAAEMEAHTKAILKHKGKPFSGRPIHDATVRATVVAVLRELSAADVALTDDYGIWSAAEVADVIEGGV